MQTADIMFFSFMAEQNFIADNAYIFLHNLSIDGHLGWLSSLALVTRAAMIMDL